MFGQDVVFVPVSALANSGQCFQLAGLEAHYVEKRLETFLDLGCGDDMRGQLIPE